MAKTKGLRMQGNKKNITADKVPSLDTLIERGVSAQQERVRVLGYIKSLEDLIRNSYYDKNDMVEAQESLARHEARLAELEQIIAVAESVKQKRIDNLKSDLSEIQDRMEFFSRKMDACDINMYDDRFQNIETDHHAYNEDYMRLYNESRKIAAEIARYQKIK